MRCGPGARFTVAATLRTRLGLAVALTLLGCPAAQSEDAPDLPSPNGPADDPTGTSTTDAASTSVGPENTASTTGASPTSTDTGSTEDSGMTVSGGTTDPGCPGGCVTPPNDCHADNGSCVDGSCEYPYKGERAACDDEDACTMGDECDGAGTCVPGPEPMCDRPNAENGACVDGECQGWTCVEPYENCDEEWDNGCEIATGLANSCNNSGMDDAGCGTAYCGIEVGPTIVNFAAENWRCVMCSNCRVPEDDMVSWCNTTNGTWWPAEAGSCPGVYEGATCDP
jgi:hypothetical protein